MKITSGIQTQDSQGHVRGRKKIRQVEIAKRDRQSRNDYINVKGQILVVQRRKTKGDCIGNF